MDKNDIIELEITDVTDTGSGIGRIDNTVVFVPQTAVGDIVTAVIIKVNKNYCIGKLLEIKTPSENRILCDCDCFSKCGGCVYRHISYDFEKQIKQKRVEDCIKRIAKIDLPPQQIVSDNNILRYRNKAQFPVSENGQVGFYANHSHRIIPTDDCLLQPGVYNKISDALKEWIKITGASVYSSESGKGLLRHLYIRSGADQKEIMAVLVINGDSIKEKELFVSMLKNAVGEKLKSVQLNINKVNNNVVLGNKNVLIYGEKYINDTICGILVRLSPNSFYQVNRDMAELLYEKAKEYACPKDKTVLDLYCGTGTIGLSMAKNAKKIIGVEIVEDAVSDAKINAEENGINNAEFICGDALKAAKELKKRNLKPDVVIVDPPRKGLDGELINIIAKDFSPERVVYVSCDPSTLARDVSLFNELGYKLMEYTPFDLFPRTAHVETAALLGRKQVEYRVEFDVDII